MEFELIQEVNEAIMGFPVDRLSHMSFGADVNGQRLLFTGSNNDFAGRPRFTQSLAWLLGTAPESEESGPKFAHPRKGMNYLDPRPGVKYTPGP